MDTSIQERHLIERYLQQELSGIELESFNERLKEDENFKRQVELQKLIYSGIQKAHHEKLKGIIFASLNYRKPVVPFALKMIVTFLVVTGVGITLWFYTGTDSGNKEQAKSWFAFLKNVKTDSESQHEGPKMKPETKTKFIEPHDTTALADAVPQPSNDSTIRSNADLNAAPDSVTIGDKEENIVVKQDQLLISSTLTVEDKSGENEPQKDESLANEAVQKLNPGADLPVPENVPSSFLVEFWVSPINYKGYKMSKNKLILFGIEEPDAVKLYRVRNELYMVYLKDFYRLDNSFDFVSYQKLKDSEIPLAIR